MLKAIGSTPAGGSMLVYCPLLGASGGRAETSFRPAGESPLARFLQFSKPAFGPLALRALQSGTTAGAKGYMSDGHNGTVSRQGGY